MTIYKEIYTWCPTQKHVLEILVHVVLVYIGVEEQEDN